MPTHKETISERRERVADQAEAQRPEPVKTKEPEWHPPTEYPPDENTYVWADVGEPDCIRVRHVKGRWMPDGQDQGVNVKQWRAE